MMPPRGAGHFVALDGMRGVAACAVALFHFHANSSLEHLWLIRSSWLFVDFFFVLSGFVIAANYRERLACGDSLVRFMLLRIGRLYPLHLFMLAVFVLTELGMLAAEGLIGGLPRPPFTGSRIPEAIPVHLILLQSFGVFPVGTWNVPAWTISAEFYVYLAFALAVIARPTGLFVLTLAALVGVPLWLAFCKGAVINVEHDGGVLRCLFGFVIGALSWRLHAAGVTVRIARPVVETVSVAATLGFIGLSHLWPPATLAAPLVFGLAVVVLAHETGFVAAVLCTRPFQVLGLLSYSIYMVHTYIFARIQNIFFILNSALKYNVSSVNTDSLMELQIWQGNLLLIFLMSITVLVSAFTYRFIEEPGRKYFRRLADRQFPVFERNGA